ncbi:alpha/beta fold hydrolase [Streptosporangiaceae bacterium NEAU-GS5]|nr:alpha/beta fold hydrolase [Streptosporangiaceae bacterium NEAU-GS5]
MPGLVLTDHVFTVPLDHADPGGRTIEVFAREVVDPVRRGDDLPWLVFFQGGPGFHAPRPTGADGFIGHAIQTHRVLLLDQRGTGRSTPITARTLATLDLKTDAEIAAYLRHFRADSIVADAEHIRRTLLGDGQWEVLGQSFGGFITLSYLSVAPHGLRACYVTGGLAGLEATADDVYTRTYAKVLERNRRHFARFPGDAGQIKALVDRLRAEDVRLPDGDRLTVRRLQLLGDMLGMSDGSERLHWLLEDGLTDAFLYQVMAETSFAAAPLYAVLHEPIYAQRAATNWSAGRLLPAELAEDADPVLLTGEMTYPWMYDDIRALHPFKGAVHLLAAADDWPRLYDPARLIANEVPVAAAVYHDDMYVDVGLSLDTARRVGNVRAWVTNEYEHDGVRVDPARVLGRLMDMASGRV